MSTSLALLTPAQSVASRPGCPADHHSRKSSSPNSRVKPASAITSERTKARLITSTLTRGMVGTRMAAPRETSYGPWLVALGTALWGTESAWRIPLNDLFPADVIVLWEHIILVALALPLILPRLGELRRV